MNGQPYNRFNYNEKIEDWWKGWNNATYQFGYEFIIGDIEQVPSNLLALKDIDENDNWICSHVVTSFVVGWNRGCARKHRAYRKQGAKAHRDGRQIIDVPFSKSNDIDHPIRPGHWFKPSDNWLEGWLSSEKKEILVLREKYVSEIDTALKKLFIVNDDLTKHFKFSLSNDLRSIFLSPIKCIKSMLYVRRHKNTFHYEYSLLEKSHFRPYFMNGSCEKYDNLEDHLNHLRFQGLSRVMSE